MLHSLFTGQSQAIQQLRNSLHILGRNAQSIKSFLHDLYYGEYEPSVFKEQDKKQQVLNHTVSAAETALRGELSKTPAALAAFEVYQTAAGERNSAVIEQAFESGYRTAMQMLFAGLVSAPPEDHANG